MNLAERLKEQRMKSGHNQTQLAQKLNLTQPGIDTLITLAKIFGVSLDYLVGVSDIENPYSIEQLTPAEANLVARYRKLSYENRIRIDERMMVLSEKQTKE